MIKKIICLILLSILYIGGISAQRAGTTKLNGPTHLSSDDGSKIIDPSLFKEDFITFKNALQQTHPALYRFHDKQITDKLFDSCYRTLGRRTTEEKFYSIIKFLLSSIEDGHLYCGPSPDFKKYYDENAKVFPLQLRFIKDNAYVICSHSDSLPSETQILSINAEPMNKIKKELFRYIVSDGSIQTKKYWVLSNNFWFYYVVVFGQQSAFDITYRTKDGKVNTTTLHSDLKKNIECIHDDVNQGNNLQLTYENNNIALLTIRTFNSDMLAKSNEEYPNFIQSTFKELADKKIHKLIIDLRGNGGGIDDYGSLLYSYLTDKEFQYYTSLQTSRQTLTKDTRPAIPIQNDSDDNFKGRTNLQTQKPSENNFKGEVFFLIDGLSFSTTAEFCAIARSNDRGKFIGEETGGGYYGNTSGNSVSTILPNTKITIDIPTTKYVMAVKKVEFRDRGIIPDFPVIPTINDILTKKDVQLNLALKLAGQE